MFNWIKKLIEKWNLKSKKQKVFIIGTTIIVLSAAGYVAYKLTGRNVIPVAKALESGNEEALLDALEAAEQVAQG